MHRVFTAACVGTGCAAAVASVPSPVIVLSPQFTG